MWEYIIRMLVSLILGELSCNFWKKTAIFHLLLFQFNPDYFQVPLKHNRHNNMGIMRKINCAVLWRIVDSPQHDCFKLSNKWEFISLLWNNFKCLLSFRRIKTSKLNVLMMVTSPNSLNPSVRLAMTRFRQINSIYCNISSKSSLTEAGARKTFGVWKFITPFIFITWLL